MFQVHTTNYLKGSSPCLEQREGEEIAKCFLERYSPRQCCEFMNTAQGLQYTTQLKFQPRNVAECFRVYYIAPCEHFLSKLGAKLIYFGMLQQYLLSRQNARAHAFIHVVFPYTDVQCPYHARLKLSAIGAHTETA